MGITSLTTRIVAVSGTELVTTAPGTIDIKYDHLIDTVADIGLSVARHGFRRMIIANGHGSNVPVMELAARKINNHSDTLCASFIWPNLVLESIRKHRTSAYPGGMAHAGELETSLYLHLNRDAIKMDQAKKDFNIPKSDFIYHDLASMGPVSLAPRHSTISDNGTIGDPTAATPEKGAIWFDHCWRRFIELIRDFRTWKARGPQDHH